MARKFGPNKLLKFKNNFLKRKAELLKSIEAKSDIELDVDGDEIDVVQGMQISELTKNLSKREVHQLNRLNKALEKIDEGTFGKCTNCDSNIGEKRLLALPGIDTCISCAEEEERASKQFMA